MSMRPSSWNGVGAMAKVPAAVWVSFMFRPLLRFSVTARSVATKQSSLSLWPLDCFAALAMTEYYSKPPRRVFHGIFREENLPGVIDDILRLPSLARRLPAV